MTVERAQLKAKFTHILVDLHHLIEADEEKTIGLAVGYSLTLQEIHLISSVDLEDACCMSYLADCLGLKNSSITACVNKLTQKGFLEKKKGGEDARYTYVSLTPLGERINLYHRAYHERMADIMVGSCTPQEVELLLSSMERFGKIYGARVGELESRVHYRVKQYAKHE